MISTILVIVLLGCITSYFAKERGRDPVLWFFIGALFGLLGLFALFILPNPSQEEVKSDEGILATELLPDPLDKQWYYLDEANGQHGPMGISELKTCWKAKTINSMTYVWCEGMQNWRTVSEISGMEERMKYEV